MNNTKKITSAFIIFGILFLTAVLMRSALYENLVIPFTFLFTILYAFFMSIDQKIYWILFTFSIMLYIFYRWMQQPVLTKQKEDKRINVFIQRFYYWQTSLHLSHDEIDKPNDLRRDLINILMALIGERHSNLDQRAVYQALREGKIPLPAAIHSFLFPTLSGVNGFSYNQTRNSLWINLKKRTERLKGRHINEYYQSIEEVLFYLESLMESKS